MKIQIRTSYPWPGIKGEDCIIELSDNFTLEELDKIAFEYALDLIFDRGVTWSYDIIKEGEE